jgi:hypothetical protein
MLLAEAIEEAKSKGEVGIVDSKKTADLIFIFVEGAYYYLSLYDDDEQYFKKLDAYKQAALDLLKVEGHQGI